MTIIAKPVIDKKFWILQKDNEKIGNIEATAGGYQVVINNQVEKYKTIRMAAQRANIHFETSVKVTKPNVHLVHGFPASGRVFNPVWDVLNQLPLYTKSSKSKSWFATGWYLVKKGRKWKIVQDPKLILLERYPYHGPFHSKDATENHTHD
jgi:hypothetical protein